jgi:hypothetical protein
MDQINLNVVLQLSGLVTIMFLSFIAVKTLKYIKIESFGNDDVSKAKAFNKIVRSIFIFLCLCLILLAGIFKLFQEQVILLLFIAGLGALGINFIKEFKE